MRWLNQYSKDIIEGCDQRGMVCDQVEHALLLHWFSPFLCAVDDDLYEFLAYRHYKQISSSLPSQDVDGWNGNDTSHVGLDLQEGRIHKQEQTFLLRSQEGTATRKIVKIEMPNKPDVELLIAIDRPGSPT